MHDAVSVPSLIRRMICPLPSRAVILAASLALVLPWDATASPDSLPDTLKNHADSTIRLDRMTVTATRTQRALSEIPASVSVITKTDIEASPARDINDLLMNQAGVMVKRSVGMGEGIPADISIRGVPGAFAASRTLILVDGIPTNVSGTPFLIINEIPVEAIERVEVVRGPFSCLYGANAFGGVISVTTKQITDGYHGTVWGGLGNFALWDAGLWASGNAPAIGFSVTGGLRGVGNYLARDQALERHGSFDVLIDTANHDYYDQRFLGRMRWRITDRTSLTLQARYFYSDLGFGKTKSDTINSTNKTPSDIITKGRKIVVGPMLQTKVNDMVDLRVGGFVRRLYGDFYNEAPSYEVHVPDTQWIIRPTSYVLKDSIVADSTRFAASYWGSISDDGQIEAMATVRLPWNTISVGGDYLYNKVAFGATVDRQTGVPLLGSVGRTERIANTGLYVQDEMTPVKGLMILPGLRFDAHSRFGSVLSPKLGVSYAPTKLLQTRLSAGSAFRAPALSETAIPNLTIQPGIIMHANPDLRPERLWALDGGVVLKPLPRTITLELDGFYNGMSDLISPQISSDVVDYYAAKRVDITFRNVSVAWSSGLEASSSIDLARFTVPASLFVNYAYTRSRDETTGNELDYVPRHKGAFGVRIGRTIGPVSIEGTASEGYVGARSYLDWQAPGPDSLGDNRNWTYDIRDMSTMRPVPHPLADYWRTDAAIRVSYKTLVWLLLDVQNITDARYEESGGTWAPGRIFSVKLNVGL
jgi:outer membrane receptor for ferrienterochelin and colicins